MISTTSFLLVGAALAWTMLIVAALARTRAFSSLRGLLTAFGNREGLPPSSGFAGRADRAATNTIENLTLFAVVLVAASLANVPADRLAVPCGIFVGFRVVYTLLYWAGVKYLRTLAWGLSLIGLTWIGLLAAVA